MFYCNFYSQKKNHMGWTLNYLYTIKSDKSIWCFNNFCQWRDTAGDTHSESICILCSNLGVIWPSKDTHKLLAPNRCELDLSNEVLKIHFCQGAEKILEVKVRGRKKICPVSRVPGAVDLNPAALMISVSTSNSDLWYFWSL